MEQFRNIGCFVLIRGEGPNNIEFSLKRGLVRITFDKDGAGAGA
jgi:hypothetical protein